MLTIQEHSSILLQKEGEVLLVEPYGPDVLRVRCSIGPGIHHQDWTLLPPKPSQAKAERREDRCVLENGRISCHLTEKGQLTFYNQAGKVLLQEEWTSERDMRGRFIRTVSGDLCRFETQFFPHENEHLYGMGQEAHDLFDLKGSVIDLCQQNTKVTIPFVVSDQGYSFLWNNPGIGRAEFGTSRTRWVAEATRQMDYLVIAADRISDHVKKLSELTGYAPPFPKWATGLWQSKLRYLTQEELLEVAREYQRRNIPLSMIVCDFYHWTQQGEWKFDPQYWPDPSAMVKELHDMGIQLLLSIWPTVDSRSENFFAMKDRNMLIRTERGMEFLQFFRGPQTYIDPMNPETRAFVWSRVQQNYVSHGVRHFWLDEAEPEFLPYEYDNLRYALGNGMEVSCLYPYYYAQIFYDGLKAAGETEIVNLIRSAFLGSQRFGVVVWSGDIQANFPSLRRQIKAGLNLSFCAIPWWTTDIGGFHGGSNRDPAYRELMVRWFQFGAFSPVFRMHGNRENPNRPAEPPYDLGSFCPSGGDNEIWSFGEEAYEIMKKYVWIRENLRPYIQEQFDLASADGTPITRPMVYEFCDPECANMFDQYLFGPDLMVCPVYEAGCTQRQVYLPRGQAWQDAYTGERLEGGQWICVSCPLDTIPLFLREGGALSPKLFQVE